jgi:hypothetical protein
MKRIQMVLAALAIVVTSLAAFSVPAMANDLDCRNAKGELIRCDGDLYAPYDRGSYYDDNDNYYPPFYSPFSNPFSNDFNYGDYDEDYFEDYFEDYLEDNHGDGYYHNW